MSENYSLTILQERQQALEKELKRETCARKQAEINIAGIEEKLENINDAIVALKSRYKIL